MNAKKVVVIRTSEKDKDWVWNELKNGRLRQGWGITGLQFEENGELVPYQIWEKRYKDSSREIWKHEPKPDEPLKRYRILRTMTDLDKRCLVVVPKMPTNSEFVIAEISGRYWFDQERGPKDFGHVIPVDNETLKKLPYSASLETKLIEKKLRGYQAAVNNVWDSRFEETVFRLYAAVATPNEKDIRDIYLDMKKPLLEKALQATRDLPFKDLERLVRIAFEEAGYKCERTNRFDGQGGDADIIFSRDLPLVTDFTDKGLTVFVQVKQKTGIDSEDVKGIEQLVKISADDSQSLRILLSTADEFSPECHEQAQEERIILIPGLEASEILLKYL
jgi:hypothetical protein